jgi:LemA protein
MGTQEITPEKLAQENMISGTLKSIFALSENYPDLKADSQFLNLQNQWQEIEDRLQAARR